MLKYLYLLLITSYSIAQTNTFEKGKILNTLPVKNSTETYALYLPTSFDAQKKSAVVFIFDPGGNGKLGVQVFAEAAEKYNYILVCSNVNKNGIPYDQNFKIAGRLIKTIVETFKIDDNQVYVAGFSGGSRLALAIAALTNKIQGVIACGAGLIKSEAAFMPKKNAFSYVGLVGDEDMNYQEMFDSRTLLNELSITNELIVYDDHHRWPSKVQIMRAFQWLELQAYKKKLRKADAKNISEFYTQQYKIADSLEKHKNYFRAVLEYENIADNFKEHVVIDSIQTKITALKASKVYKEAAKNRKKLLVKENKIFEELSDVYTKDIIRAASDDNFVWWKKEIKRLNAALENATEIQEIKMYKRLKYAIFAVVYESSMAYVGAQEYKHALYCDQLLSHFNPEQPYWYYRLAQSHARNNDFTKTIRNLKKAKELNFRYFQQIQNAPEFAKYKHKKKFSKLFE